MIELIGKYTNAKIYTIYNHNVNNKNDYNQYKVWKEQE